MTKVNVTEVSSAVITNDPEQLLAAMRERRIVNFSDLDYVIAPKAAIVGLADQLAEEELLEEMVSYRKDVTGVDNTIFISPKGNIRHAPRIKLAINPPDSVDPRGETVVIAIPDGTVVAGNAPPRLLKQASAFVTANRDVLLDYWEYRIDTETLRRRLKSI